MPGNKALGVCASLLRLSCRQKGHSQKPGRSAVITVKYFNMVCLQGWAELLCIIFCQPLPGFLMLLLPWVELSISQPKHLSWRPSVHISCVWAQFQQTHQLLDRSRTQLRTAAQSIKNPVQRICLLFGVIQNRVYFQRFTEQLSLEETSGDHLVQFSLLQSEIKKTYAQLTTDNWGLLQNLLKQLLSQEEGRNSRPSVWEWHSISNDQLSDLEWLCFVLPIKKNKIFMQQETILNNYLLMSFSPVKHS